PVTQPERYAAPAPFPNPSAFDTIRWEKEAKFPQAGTLHTPGHSARGAGGGHDGELPRRLCGQWQLERTYRRAHPNRGVGPELARTASRCRHARSLCGWWHKFFAAGATGTIAEIGRKRPRPASRKRSA